MTNNPQDNALSSLAERWKNAGFLTGIDIISSDEAGNHRNRLEQMEANVGSLHYKPKIHTLLCSPFELATNTRALDVVEQLLGPDILLYNATYIVKEPDRTAHVSWHQDLTYWGLSSDRQVTMWLALSPATPESGCMRMIPGSHLHGQQDHLTTADPANVLYQGQTVPDVNERDSVECPLAPGQASFHHGWTLHASTPNQSTDRRIGLNVQYLSPEVYQTKNDFDTAMLVRGTDRHQHFGTDSPARSDWESDALTRHAELQQRYEEIAGSN